MLDVNPVWKGSVWMMQKRSGNSHVALDRRAYMLEQLRREYAGNAIAGYRRVQDEFVLVVDVQPFQEAGHAPLGPTRHSKNLVDVGNVLGCHLRLVNPHFLG